MHGFEAILKRHVAGLLVALLLAPAGEACRAQAAQAAQAQPAQTDGVRDGQAAGAKPAVATGADGVPKSTQTAPAQSAPEQQQTQPQQQTQEQQQSGTQKPLGTAAAPYEKPEGVAAARPAGAAIAPAKQRRVRTILIRMGVIAGAAVALGTVVALSHGSPSTPPK